MAGRFGIRRSLASEEKAGAVRLTRVMVTAALAVAVGQSASCRAEARALVSDPADVLNDGCHGRPGDRAAIISFEPVVPAEAGDMTCGTAPLGYASPLPSRPVPAPVPESERGAGEVNPLEVGLNIGRRRGHRDGMRVGSLVLTGQFGFIQDRVGNARRARLQFSFQPAPHVDLGLCATDGFSDIGETGLRGRCLATVESEFSYVFARGLAYFISPGEFGGVGGKVQYDLAAPIRDKAALVVSMSYRRVPTMIGRAPDVRRWESAIKYRFYVAAVMGVDLGVTLGKGTEPKSLMPENRIQAGIGLTF